jgi:two-component system OmpR family response regulator
MNPKPNILVVDDDEGITSLLCSYLARFNFVAHAAADDQAMWALIDSQPIDLLLLDLMLPNVDGLTLARMLRERSTLPFIILTARCDPADRVVGLEMGADDYISKPFEPRELVARIQAVLRRTGALASAGVVPAPRAEVVRFEGWALHRDDRRLTSPAGQAVALSTAEYQLLSTFLKTPGQIVSRAELMASARGRQLSVSGRSIDLLVSRLRQKLADEAGEADLIRTVRGLGYVFDAQPVPALSA